MKYYILSELVKKGINISPIIDEILLMTIEAKKTYPEYPKWLVEKQYPGIYNGTRDIIIAVDNNMLVGVANIKKDSEKKICTLYFRPEYRYKRIGKVLVDKSIALLECTNPLITVPSHQLGSFKNLIKRYNWELTDSIDDCYSPGNTEFIFNGELALPNKELSKEERLLLTYKNTKNRNLLKLVPFGYIKYLLFYKKDLKIEEIYS